MEHRSPVTPRAFAALEAFPALRDAVGASLRRQAARAAMAQFPERQALLEALLRTAAACPGGLVALEGPPGSGVTAALVALAARIPAPLWLGADDAGRGAEAFYAQVAALRRPHIPLIDPSAATDPGALERLLAEVAADPEAERLILLVDMPGAAGQPARALPPPLPADLPPGATLIVGCEPGATLPRPPTARICLPADDPQLVEVQARVLTGSGCPPAEAGPLIAASAGNLLYLDLAWRMRSAGLLGPEPPAGLDALLGAWWAGLDAGARRLALLLAAAGEPLPLVLAAELLGADPGPTLASWEALGLVDLTVQSAGEGEPPLLLAAFAHAAPRRHLAGAEALALALAHADLVAAGLARVAMPARPGAPRDQPGALFDPDPAALYLSRQFARHAALAGPEQRREALPRVAARDWQRAAARHGGAEAARRAARWELAVASLDGPPLRLARALALAGNQASQARELSPDAVVEALLAGVERGGREAALKRVLELVERLPDGLDKALILRRLGEACYGARMRSSAMRLLSRALDLEAQPASRAWREQREQLLAALATAALDLGDPDAALAIAERIEHLERRAQVETAVARWLVAAGDLDRAQRVARGILHESMGMWARAEVAVALVRAGDTRGALLLEEITTETVAAWAQIELACDELARDEEAAMRRVQALPTPGQRDRGLARLAHALALADKDGDALAAAEQVEAVEVRVAALIDLRLRLEGLVAMLALERATADIGAVTGDDRAPLVAALAAALATLGRQEQARALAEQLPAGEERDRALARVAVAIAQGGDHERWRAMLEAVDDQDERDWALDEIARQLARAGRWEEALATAAAIAADDQRARTSADMAIERARGGHPLPALGMALAIEVPQERVRALTMVAPQLVAHGHHDLARSLPERPQALPGGEVRARYLAAVVAALAAHGAHEEAEDVAAGITRPIERARAELAIAQTLAADDPGRAIAAMGRGFRAAAVGREEAFRALELAAPTLGALGGAELLAAVAAAVDDLDRW